MLWIDETSLIKNLIIKSLKCAACWGDVFIHYQQCPHSSNLIRAWFLYLAHLFLQTLLINQSRQNKPVKAELEAKKETFADKTRSHTENNNAVCKFDFSGKLSYSSAKQTHCRVSAEHQEWLTTDKRLWLGVEWAPQWGDWADCWGVDGWQACQGPIQGWFMLIRAGGSCGCFLWSVK